MAQKDASVAELTKNFENSTAVLLTEYRGLTVAQLKQLRNDIRQDADYAVVKNTLTSSRARPPSRSCTATPSPSRRACVPSPRLTLSSW